MLMRSRPVYEAYTSPLGLGWMVTPGSHYGPDPDGYEYSRWGTYHRADSEGVGVDRTSAHGSGFTSQYRDPWRRVFDDPSRCPEELLLFFHHLPYGHVLGSGVTLIQHIYDSHFAGAAAAAELVELWRSLAGRVDPVRFRVVEERLVRQALHAQEWRDVVNAHFHRRSGIPDARGRRLF
jgi:alpha-glucuronidase